jgi:hypothetical protein
MSAPGVPPPSDPAPAGAETDRGAANGGAAASAPTPHCAACDRASVATETPDQATRRPTQEDVVAGLKKQQREQEAFRVALLKIRERALPMKLTRVEQMPDLSRLVFYFTAEGRVDFRELVRELVSEFRTRIEMRQIGVRDEAKLLGGYGSCGRPLCCTTWLQSFEPISIRMAKQQELSLNPSKLSGLCGRLKCCLRYELGNGRPVKEAAGGRSAEGSGSEPGPESETPHG